MPTYNLLKTVGLACIKEGYIYTDDFYSTSYLELKLIEKLHWSVFNTIVYMYIVHTIHYYVTIIINILYSILYYCFFVVKTYLNENVILNRLTKIY